MDRCLTEFAAGKSFYQPDELADFSDFFLERLAREFFSHRLFHNFGSFSLWRRKIFSNFVLSISASCSRDL
jgi:hypothetical protein